MIVRLAIVVLIVLGAAAFGLWWQRRSSRVRGGAGRFSRAQLAAVGLRSDGAEALAVLMGSPTCAPCVTVKQILAEVVAERPAFRWTYVDAADHLDVADAHRVMRVPTLFVLDLDGTILARTSGVPAKADLLRVLDRDGALDPAA